VVVVQYVCKRQTMQYCFMGKNFVVRLSATCYTIAKSGSKGMCTAQLHGLISGNHKHPTATPTFTLQLVCSYECMLQARLQSTVVRNRPLRGGSVGDSTDQLNSITCSVIHCIIICTHMYFPCHIYISLTCLLYVYIHCLYLVALCTCMCSFRYSS